MQNIRLNERRAALLVAAILVLVSVAATFRYTDAVKNAKNSASTEFTQRSEPNKGVVNNRADVDSSKLAEIKKEAGAPAPAVYTYTAAPGDTYYVFAQDAIAQYVAAKNISITAEQLVNASMDLATAAGSPLLEIGQTVSIEEAAITQELATIGVNV